jgi:hypothetical protein
MPAIISDKFRIFNAKQFIESFTEGSSDTGDERTRMYFFVGRPQRWDAYLEIFSKNATAFAVGDEVYVGASYGAATFKGVVREVFEESLLLYNVTGSAGIQTAPTVGSTLKGYSGGSDTGATALTGIYRYSTDEIPPLPLDNQTEKHSVYDDIIAAKRITSEFVRTVIRRYNWQTNTTYDMWKPDYFATQTGRTGKSTATGQTSISDAKFYVMNSKYEIWKCIYNGQNPANPNGQASTAEPALVPASGSYDSGTGLYTEVSGIYVWKYMYTIPTDDVLRFLSSDFMPIVLPTEPSRAGVIANQVVAGAIDSYIIEDAGSNLPADGTYYAPVLGDGTGAYAQITIAGGAVTGVTVGSRGSGYTYGSIALKTGTGSGATAYGLFTNTGLTSSATVGSSATGQIEVVIPLQGGHGSDMEVELNGKRVMTNIRLTYAEGFGDFPVDNDFRRIGIIRDPYERGTTTYATADTLNGLTALKITGAGADYIPDEIVRQNVTNGVAIGTVVSWTPDAPGSFNGILKVFQSPDYHKDNGVVRAFENNANPVDADTSLAIGTVDGTYNAAANNDPNAPFFGNFANGISLPEIDNNSGDLIYIENRRLITRAADQIEDIKLVIEF